MTQLYFVITCSDGDTIIDTISKEELTKRLNNQYYGDKINVLKKIEHEDTNYWGEKMAIIKGELVVPEPIEVIKQFDIE